MENDLPLSHEAMNRARQDARDNVLRRHPNRAGYSNEQINTFHLEMYDAENEAVARAAVEADRTKRAEAAVTALVRLVESLGNCEVDMTYGSYCKSCNGTVQGFDKPVSHTDCAFKDAENLVAEMKENNK